MQQPSSIDRPISWTLAGLGSVAAACLRVFAILPNISAVGGLALFCGGRLKWWFAWVPPLAVMVATDLVLARLYGYPMFNPWVYASYMLYVLIGCGLARTNSVARIAGAGGLGALQFFLITNFGAWYNQHGVATPMYPHTFDGLVQCYIAGLPFLGYTLIGDLGSAAALFGAHAMLTQTVPAQEEVRV
jgi:hypothetical protein